MEQHTAHSRWWGRDTPNVRRIAAVAYLLMLLVLVAYAQIRPVNNWDMLAYVGIARSIEVNDADELHAEVYRLLRRSVPASDVEALTGTSSEATTSLPFLAATANDPRAFTQQLPFYLVKPAYPLLIAGVSLLGVDPFDASVLIASAAYVAFALLLVAWLRRYHPSPGGIRTRDAARPEPAVLDPRAAVHARLVVAADDRGECLSPGRTAAAGLSP